MLSRQRAVMLMLIVGVLLAGGLLAGAQGPPPAFDLETGDPLREAIIPRLVPALIAEVSPTLGDVTLVNRVNSVTILAMMDALAPYHPTAVGAYTRLERQPEAERTHRNMNIASLHAAYHALTAMIPARASVWREMLDSAGLDADDASMNPNSPVGIGNLAGKGAVSARLHDGYNQLGNYADDTGYAPVNSPTELVDAGRWQPDITRRGIGIHVAQQFVTPQVANVEPFGDLDPRQLRVPPPASSDPDNWEAYKAQVDEVLAASANMTDEQKMLAEIFDNKVRFLRRVIPGGFTPFGSLHCRKCHRRLPGDAGDPRRRHPDLAGKAALGRCSSLQRYPACLWRRHGERLGRSWPRRRSRCQPANGRATCKKPTIQNIPPPPAVFAQRRLKPCAATPALTS